MDEPEPGTNETISIPSVISKMSLANGLIHTYTKPKGPATIDPWYFTAVDFHSGERVYSQLAGTGVHGGVVAMRDTE